MLCKRPTACALAGLALAFLAAPVFAQRPWHLEDHGDDPPGAIGLKQLQRGGPRAGYFQPVQVTAPQGALISIAAEGAFLEPKREKALAGMLIGHVYRLKISNIDGFEGAEVFPTIEVIDRLYPPPGQATRFPIPVVLTQEELLLAIDGRYVQRVIYLEEPRTAPAVQDAPGTQRYFEVAAEQDPLEVADRLGRPVAILRMGSRVPGEGEDEAKFLYANPPVIVFEPPALTVPRDAGLEEPLEAPPRQGKPSRNFKREQATQWR
jgi:hypothetical protein